jgi:hypothetical protein
MAFTHIWHQLHLHRQKIGFIVLFTLCLAGSAQAQNQKIKAENKPGYDEKRIRYGFYLGAMRSKYQIEASPEYANSGSGAPARPMNAMWSTGFYPGLVLNVRLFEYLDARFLPGVAFHTRKIDFEDPANEGNGGFEEDVTMSSTVIELPLLLKYKAKRRGNYRMYMVGGLKGSRIIGDRGDVDTQTGARLHVNKTDLSIEYGVGLDIFYPYFKFAPELRFSHGLMNQKADYASEYSNMIDRLSSRTVSLIFHFE